MNHNELYIICKNKKIMNIIFLNFLEINKNNGYNSNFKIEIHEQESFY